MVPPTPKTSSIVLASLIFGLMTGVSVVFIRHVLSPVIEDPDVVERALGIPVSAIVPHSKKQMVYNKLIARDPHYAHTKSYLLAHEHPKDFSIEGLRSLRTTIQMSLLDAMDNVMAITGCGPSVGKSFISSNLAVLMSDFLRPAFLACIRTSSRRLSNSSIEGGVMDFKITVSPFPITTN